MIDRLMTFLKGSKKEFFNKSKKLSPGEKATKEKKLGVIARDKVYYDVVIEPILEKDFKCVGAGGVLDHYYKKVILKAKCVYCKKTRAKAVPFDATKHAQLVRYKKR